MTKSQYKFIDENIDKLPQLKRIELKQDLSVLEIKYIKDIIFFSVFQLAGFICAVIFAVFVDLNHPLYNFALGWLFLEIVSLIAWAFDSYKNTKYLNEIIHEYFEFKVNSNKSKK